MKNILLSLLLMAFFSSCSSTSKGIFSKKTPHEKYAEKLDDTGLMETPAGRQWLSASKLALLEPVEVTLPYKQDGYFANDKPRALGLKFTGKQGEKITFTLTRKSSENFVLYADLFEQKGTETSLLHAADTASTTFSFNINEPGPYILRLQPELFKVGEYSLSVSVGPSLGFPVAGSKAKTGSFWGDSRDGGKRSHEGVDIFAPKRTPVVAIADGFITGVKETPVGGKVVWLKVIDRNITLYYAHLDTQLVYAGQSVKEGETLGLVGNTGNAKNTTPHLHFGIYTYMGPMDPYPFINMAIKTAKEVPDKKLTNYLRLTKAHKLGADEVITNANTLLVPVAVTSKGYISELPDGKIVHVPFSVVQSSSKPVISSTETLAGKAVKDTKARKCFYQFTYCI